jgi:hypothetical protein
MNSRYKLDRVRYFQMRVPWQEVAARKKNTSTVARRSR